MRDNTLRKINLILVLTFFITGCTQANNNINNTLTQQSISCLENENTFGLEDESIIKQVIDENPAIAMYIDKINSHEWNSLEECFSEDIRSGITQKQIDNKQGVTCVEHIELKAVKEMTADDWRYVTSSDPVVSENGEYKNLDKYNDIKFWFFIFDESVEMNHENKYYPQGLNYIFVITGKRNDSQYIIDLRIENDSADKIEMWLSKSK